jgi:hypothetical protein
MPLSETDLYEKHGLPWRTINQARYAFAQRDAMGTASAFCRIGRKKIGVNTQLYLELLAARGA